MTNLSAASAEDSKIAAAKNTATKEVSWENLGFKFIGSVTFQNMDRITYLGTEG